MFISVLDVDNQVHYINVFHITEIFYNKCVGLTINFIGGYGIVCSPETIFPDLIVEIEAKRNEALAAKRG